MLSVQGIQNSSSKYYLGTLTSAYLSIGILIGPPAIATAPKWDSGRDPAPVDFDKNMFGDHACIHNRVYGSLFVVPSQHVESITPSVHQLVGRKFKVYTDTYHSKSVIVTSIGNGYVESYAEGYYDVAHTVRQCLHGRAWSQDGDIIFAYSIGMSRPGGTSFVYYTNYSYRYWDPANLSDPFSSGRQLYRRSESIYSNRDEYIIPPMRIYATQGNLKTFYTFGYPSIDIDVSFCQSLYRAAKTPNDDQIISGSLWEDLAFNAVQDATPLNINTVQFVREVIAVKDTVKSFIDLMGGDVSPKRLADLWLTIKYGLRLTLQDANELGKFISSKSLINPKYTYVRSRGQHTFSPRKYPFVGGFAVTQSNLKVYYDVVDNPVFKMVKFIFDWDGILKLTNCWDIVPYSFVVDWFVNVESFLKRVDAHTYKSMLDVLSVIRSTKTTFYSSGDIIHGSARYIGQISARHYHRRLEKSLPDFPIFRIDSPGPFKNLPELTAIIVSNFQK